MPFAETWMDLEIFILTKSERERQISYDILYMWKLRRNDTNELIYQKNRLKDLEKKTWLLEEWGKLEGKGS